MIRRLPKSNNSSSSTVTQGFVTESDFSQSNPGAVDYNQWSEFWEQITFSMKNLAYFKAEGRDELFSLVLPRFRDGHKEWRLYRRVELEWFVEQPQRPSFNLQSDAEGNVALTKKPDVATEYVIGQFPSCDVSVFAKWTPLKTFNGETILTLSVPNNAQLRTILGLSRSKFPSHSHSFFRRYPRESSVSDLGSFTPRICFFRWYGYRYARYFPTPLDEKKEGSTAEPSEATECYHGEVPKNPNIDVNYRIIGKYEGISCKDVRFVSSPVLTTEEIFNNYENMSRRFGRRSAAVPPMANGAPYSNIITKRRKKVNLITNMFPAISSEEFFKTMEQRMRQSNPIGSDLPSTSKQPENCDGTHRMEKEKQSISESLSSVVPESVSNKRQPFPTFSLVSRNRQMTLGKTQKPKEHDSRSHSTPSHDPVKKQLSLSMSPIAPLSVSLPTISTSLTSSNSTSSSITTCSTSTTTTTGKPNATNTNTKTNTYTNTTNTGTIDECFDPYSQSGNSSHSKNRMESTGQPPIKRKNAREGTGKRSNTRKKTLVPGHRSGASVSVYPELKIIHHQKTLIQKKLSFSSAKSSILTPEENLLSSSNAKLNNQVKWLHSLRSLKCEDNKNSITLIDVTENAPVGVGKDGGDSGGESGGGVGGAVGFHSVSVAAGSGAGVVDDTCVVSTPAAEQAERTARRNTTTKNGTNIEQDKTICLVKTGGNSDSNSSEQMDVEEEEEEEVEEEEEEEEEEEDEWTGEDATVLPPRYSNAENTTEFSNDKRLLKFVRDLWHRNQVAKGNLYGKIVGEKNQSKYYGYVSKNIVENWMGEIEQMDFFEVDFPLMGSICFVHLPGLSNHVSLYKVFSKPSKSGEWIPLPHPTRNFFIRPELLPPRNHVEVQKLLFHQFAYLRNSNNESNEEISVDD